MPSVMLESILIRSMCRSTQILNYILVSVLYLRKSSLSLIRHCPYLLDVCAPDELHENYFLAR